MTHKVYTVSITKCWFLKIFVKDFVNWSSIDEANIVDSHESVGDKLAVEPKKALMWDCWSTEAVNNWFNTSGWKKCGKQQVIYNHESVRPNGRSNASFSLWCISTMRQIEKSIRQKVKVDQVLYQQPMVTGKLMPHRKVISSASCSAGLR